MRLRYLWLGIAAFTLTSCSTFSNSSDPDAIATDVELLLEEWASSVSEGRIEDFKALFSSRDGFLWAERGQFIYRSADEIAAGVDQVLGGGTTFTNELSDVIVTPLSQMLLAFQLEW